MRPVYLLALLCFALAAPTAIPVPVFSTPAQIFGENVDVAEPIIAAAPGGRLWAMASGEGVILACPECPNWPMVTVQSLDSGRTWSNYRYVCGTNCSGVALQADPWLAAAPGGTLYASWMNSLSIATARSFDGGVTWTAHVNVSGEIGPSDKDVITVSADESIVMIAFNGERYPYGVISLDKGSTWSAPVCMITDPENYPDYNFFGNGGVILPDGTCISSQGGFYNPDNSSDQSLPAALHIYASNPKTNPNGSWQRIFELKFEAAEYCPEWAQCLDEGQFFGPTVVIAVDNNGTYYIMASGSPNNTQQPDLTVRPLFFRSTDRGATWSAPLDLSTASIGQHIFCGFPLVAATGVGDVRVAWMDNRTGLWNTYYRASKDGGQNWTPEVLVSTTGGINAPFHMENGFLWPYGDYGGLAIDDEGASHLVWGEGWGWFRGGRVYYARSPPLAAVHLSHSPYWYATWALTAALVIALIALLTTTIMLCRERNSRSQYAPVQ